MSQKSALPSFWAAPVSRTNLEISGDCGTGSELSGARPPVPPFFAPASPAASAPSPAIRNQRKNDEPLMRPTIPPARPKKNAIVRYATSEFAERPDDPDDGEDHDDQGRQAGDEADDDLEQDPRRDDENDEGGEAGEDARASFLLHASIVDALEVRVARFTRGTVGPAELQPREPVAADVALAAGARRSA